MELALEYKQNRLKQFYKNEEFHAWKVQDNWVPIHNLKNKITGEYKQVNYITTHQCNPLPFNQDIEYIGIIHYPLQITNDHHYLYQ